MSSAFTLQFFVDFRVLDFRVLDFKGLDSRVLDFILKAFQIKFQVNESLLTRTCELQLPSLHRLRYEE